MRAFTAARNRELPVQSPSDLVKDLETGWRSANLRGCTLDQLIPRPVCFVTGEVHPIHDSEEAFIASLDRSEEHNRAIFSKYKRLLPTTKRYLETLAFDCEYRHGPHAEALARSIAQSDKREAREKAKWRAEHAARLAAMSPDELKKYRETPT